MLANHAEKIELAHYVKAAIRHQIALEKYYDGEIDPEIMAQLRAEAPSKGVRAELAEWGS